MKLLWLFDNYGKNESYGLIIFMIRFKKKEICSNFNLHAGNLSHGVHYVTYNLLMARFDNPIRPGMNIDFKAWGMM